MTLVVSDNSPLNILIRVGCQETLPRLFNRVVVPAEVAQEMAHPAAPTAIRKFIDNSPEWLSIQSPFKLLPLPGLDPGELAAISLAVELKAPLPIDERLGRKIATELGLDIIGAVGILERAANIGLIADLRAVHNKILAINFRIDPTILAESLHRHLTQRRQPEG